MRLNVKRLYFDPPYTATYKRLAARTLPELTPPSDRDPTGPRTGYHPPYTLPPYKRPAGCPTRLSK